jgi:hypothetical protein
MESGPPVAMVNHHAKAVGSFHQLLDGYQTQGGRGQQEGQRNWERQSRTVGRVGQALANDGHLQQDLHGWTQHHIEDFWGN